MKRKYRRRVKRRKDGNCLGVEFGGEVTLGTPFQILILPLGALNFRGPYLGTPDAILGTNSILHTDKSFLNVVN